MSADRSRKVSLRDMKPIFVIQRSYNALFTTFSCRSTTVGRLHATSLQGFGYGDVVHQFEKRCIVRT
ncbi:MAG: hypothetical protein MGU50_12205 [Trichodesmium sp. MAG_R02]|nr:hypothetical protein [Trichodesmium sp. MAG_R02]